MQIAAPSNEVTPPMSMVRFDCTKAGGYAGLPVPTANVVQGTTAAGNAEGSCTLIWYRPTCPGVKPTKSGARRITGAVGGVVLITPVRILNGRDGSAFGRKSYWSSRVRTEPRRLAGSSTGAGVGVALPVFTAGVVCPNPNA